MAKAVNLKKRPKQVEFLKPYWVYLIFFTFTILLYANTLGHDFALDDAIVITENDFTRQGISGVDDIFGKDTFHGFFGEAGKDKLVKGGRYRPLSLVLFALEYSFFGETAWIFHLMNVLWYFLTALVLYLLVFQLTSTRYSNETAYWIAFAGTLMFIAHPVHTEVVANVKGRDEILALLGSLAGLLLLVRHKFNAVPVTVLIAAGFSFFLAMLSKENAITFAAIVPVTGYLFYRSGASQLIRSSLPVLLASLGFLVIRTLVIGWDMGAESSMELMNNPYLKIEGGTYVPFTEGEKFATISHTLFRYLQLLFFPLTLTHDYYPNHISVKSFTDWTAFSGLIIYLVMVVVALWGMFRRKKWAVFPVFYLATLSIVSNIVFPVGTHMSERFIYMPSVAFTILVGVILFSGNWIRQHKIGLVLLILILVGFSWKTIERNKVWKDNFTLFTRDALISVRSAKVNNAAGGVILDNLERFSDPAERSAWIQRAHDHLTVAISEHPNYINAYLLKGNAFFYENKFDEAIAYYERCLGIDPDYEEARNNIFLTYRSAGRYYGETENNLPRSLTYLQKALALRSEDFETNRLIGTCYGIMGNHEMAIRYFQQCARLQPDNAGIYQSLSQAYRLQGNIQAAEEALAKSRILSGSNGN